MQSKFTNSDSPTQSYSETLIKSTGQSCQPETGSSRAVFPAKIFPSLVKALGWLVRDPASGTSTPELLASYDPATQSWRTSELSLFGGSIPYLGALPRSGTMRSGKIYAPPMSERPIDEKESGLWPTARTKGLLGGSGSREMVRAMVEAGTIEESEAVAMLGVKMFPTPSATEYGTNQGGGMGRTGPVRSSLGTMARKGLWPTPRLSDAERGGRGDLIQAVRGNPNKHYLMMPTPIANRRHGLQSHGVNVVSGSLNPVFVEWLMGYPLGWTDLNASGTALSLKLLN